MDQFFSFSLFEKCSLILAGNVIKVTSFHRSLSTDVLLLLQNWFLGPEIPWLHFLNVKIHKSKSVQVVSMSIQVLLLASLLNWFYCVVKLLCNHLHRLLLLKNHLNVRWGATPLIPIHIWEIHKIQEFFGREGGITDRKPSCACLRNFHATNAIFFVMAKRIVKQINLAACLNMQLLLIICTACCGYIWGIQ